MLKLFITLSFFFFSKNCLEAELTVPTKEVSHINCKGCPSNNNSDFYAENCVFKYSDFKFNGHFEMIGKKLKMTKYINFYYICRTANTFNIELTISNKINRFDNAFLTSFQLDTGIEMDENNFNVPVQSQKIYFSLPNDTRFETKIGMIVSDEEFEKFVNTFSLFKNDDFDSRIFKLEELQQLDFLINRLQYKMVKEKTFIAENQKIRLIFDFPKLTKNN